MEISMYKTYLLMHALDKLLENFLKMSAKKMMVLFLLSILSFFGCYCVTPVPEESDRGHTITAKKPTTSTNSHQRTQEYIKGKSPSFTL